MADYIYVTNTKRLKAFLGKIQEVGIPDKVTIKYLEGLGFKSKNDRSFISVAKNLGLISSSGEPTERWKAYRNKKNGPGILAQIIREHYNTLYQMYSDAHMKDNEALRNFFSTHTSVGAGALDFMVRTFKTIAGLADFEAEGSLLPHQGIAVSSEDVGTRRQPRRPELVLNVNIQLALPEGSTADTFEDFFKAMKKYLFD